MRIVAVSWRLGGGLRKNRLAGACLLPHAKPLPLGGGNAGPNLVFGMKWLLGTYTKRFNIRHKICGHLFAGRY